MTAKHATYLAIVSGEYNLRELQALHRSLQVRRIGKSDYQIRFRDNESWQTPEDWSLNYRNSLLKQLADLVTADLQVLPPEVILSQLPKDSQQALILPFINRAIEKRAIVPADEYNDLLNKFSELKNRYLKCKASLEQMKSRPSDPQL